MQTNVFRIEGFHCEACVKLATMKIGKIEGVMQVQIDQAGLAEVQTEREVTIGQVRQALQGTGYVVKQGK